MTVAEFQSMRFFNENGGNMVVRRSVAAKVLVILPHENTKKLRVDGLRRCLSQKPPFVRYERRRVLPEGCQIEHEMGEDGHVAKTTCRVGALAAAPVI